MTDRYPVDIFYVEHLDQVWIVNWRDEEDHGVKTIQVIREASQKKKHHTVHPEPIDGHFDLVYSLFIPPMQVGVLFIFVSIHIKSILILNVYGRLYNICSFPVMAGVWASLQVRLCLAYQSAWPL